MIVELMGIKVQEINEESTEIDSVDVQIADAGQKTSGWSGEREDQLAILS